MIHVPAIANNVIGDAAVPRARTATLALFACNGLLIASWLSRLPATRHTFGLDTSVWGMLLMCGALGSFVVYPVMGALVARLGSARVLRLSTLCAIMGLSLVALGLVAAHPVLFAIGLFIYGACWGVGGVPANMEAAEIERRLGRTVLPQFHGAYSVGAVAGAGLGSLLAGLHVSVPAQLLGSCVLFGAIRLVAIANLLPTSRLPGTAAARGRQGARGRGRTTVRGGALGAWFEKRTLLLGLIFFAAFIGEGAANDWLATSVVDGFDQPEATGALVLSVFLAAMTLMRLCGAKLIDRYGRVSILRASHVSALIGLAIYLLAPSLPLALVGVIAWGLGAAMVGPIAISAATEDPLKAASRVAVISTMGSGLALASPSLLGLLGSYVSTRYALGAVGVILLFSIVIGRAVAPHGSHAVRQPMPSLFSSRPVRRVALWSQRGAALAAVAVGGPAPNRTMVENEALSRLALAHR